MTAPRADIESDLAEMPQEFRRFLDNLVGAALQAASDVGMSRVEALLVLAYVGRRAREGINTMAQE
ncbi:MAG: hypothetical protein RLZZ200_649 [Pseudomonadota bacterium]|jgi:hypothetical protein